MNRTASQPGSRRSLLTGRPAAFRPPWSTEQTILSGCTSCGDCIRSCPQAILIPGPGQTPVVDFSRSECTFCGDCADACPEPVFIGRPGPPWNLTARIDAGCMLNAGISCRLCTDSCDAQALRFDLSQRPAGRVTVDTGACTGCGACISACPIDAIDLSRTEVAHA